MALPAAPTVSTVTISTDISKNNLYALLTSGYWKFSTSTKSLSYSFPTSVTQYPTGYENIDPTLFEPMTVGQAAVVRNALALYQDVSQLVFVEAKGADVKDAILKFSKANVDDVTAVGYFPSYEPRAGDAWFFDLNQQTPVLGSYEYIQILHEIGHTLGLKHPHEPLNFNDGVNIYKNDVELSLDIDSIEYSVMSYRSYRGQSVDADSFYENETFGYAQSLMMLDIQAIQFLYGANYNTNSGNTTYKFDANTGAMFINGVSQGTPGDNRIFRTIWDGGGTDTYDLSNYNSHLSINLKPGASSTFSQSQLALLNSYYVSTRGDMPIYASGNVYNALLFNGDTRSLIENAIGGAGNDDIFGNQANNSLSGSAGDDYLDGDQGADTLSGGTGSDILLGGGGNDSLDGGSEIDYAIYGGKRADYVMTYNATSKVWTIKDTGTNSTRFFGSADGTDSVKNVEVVFFFATQSFAFLTSSGTTVSYKIKASVDNDFVTDIYFRNQNTGQVATWLLASDGSVKSYISGEFVSSDWQLAGIGDFDFDAISDFLWINSRTGEVTQWLIDGEGSYYSKIIGVVTQDWIVAAVADFNNDGTDDILWRNKVSGDVGRWLLNIDGSMATAAVLRNVSTDWSIIAGKDMNDDGIADVLWRNSNSGTVAEWFMAADGSISSVSILGPVSSDWKIESVDDFSFDGIPDILWRNSLTGETALWNLNKSGGVDAYKSFGMVDASWQIAATGDYNGDGITDILWRHASSGEIATWMMAPGGTVSDYKFVNIVTSDWQIAKV